MNKQLQQDLIQLTQECLIHFWQLDCEFVLKYCDENVVWIGSAQSQFIKGYAETARDFRSIMKEIKPCHLLRQEFIVVQNSGNACSIVGRYYTTTDDDVEYFLQAQQRCSFTWELVNGEPKIKHMHVSNPMGELKLGEGERFPNASGKMAQKYWLEHLSIQQTENCMLVIDREGANHFLSRLEILYASAHGRNCEIYTLSGKVIKARMSISEFFRTAGECFSMTHRCYVVNRELISKIEKYVITMIDGSKIPIPAKRYTEVRDMLMEQYKAATEEE